MSPQEANEQIILVDENDRQIGIMGKEEVHQKGLLHRAVSVFVFNSKNELLLQRRASTKYHSAGLWTNTSCTHPRPNESNKDAAERRLYEEMGMKVQLEYSFSFKYETKFKNGLIENEYDHVFQGVSDETPVLNPEEVDEWRYTPINEIVEDILLNHDSYTSWFKICLSKQIEFSSVRLEM